MEHGGSKNSYESLRSSNAFGRGDANPPRSELVPEQVRNVNDEESVGFSSKFIFKMVADMKACTEVSNSSAQVLDPAAVSSAALLSSTSFLMPRGRRSSAICGI